jgi:hypothetical protein
LAVTVRVEGPLVRTDAGDLERAISGFHSKSRARFRRIKPPRGAGCRRRVVILGAAGRDFHTFNVVYRSERRVEVVAFAASQIPLIDDRTCPASLAGEGYPRGIPIHDESELTQLIKER